MENNDDISFSEMILTIFLLAQMENNDDISFSDNNRSGQVRARSQEDRDRLAFQESNGSIFPNQVRYDPSGEELEEVESETPDYVVGSKRSRIEDEVNNHMSLYLESLRDYGMIYTTWDRVETRQRMVRMMMEALFQGGESWLSVRWPNDWCEVTMQLGPHMLEAGAVAFINWLLRGHLAEKLVIVDDPTYTCHDFWELVGIYVKKLPGPNIVRFEFFS